jgi:hypothetical protein
LKLCSVQKPVKRTSDHVVLQKFFLYILEARSFALRIHTSKVPRYLDCRRLDYPIGTDDETHRLDSVNFFCPRLGKRLSRSNIVILSTIVEESSLDVQEVQAPSPSELDFRRVSTAQETKVDELVWHIARVPYNLGKSCWSMHTNTEKKCTAKLVTNNLSVACPAYSGV